MTCVGSSRWSGLIKSASALLVATVAAVSGANAQSTYLPSIKIGTAALIAPVSANTFYGSNTTSTDGLSGLTHTETPTPPEIIELALALKNDPDLIYQYVHNNIQTVWMYGLQKGALGAEIDKSGTPFDQAELMMALLRQSNVTASYVAGTVQFSQAQFSAWTGITGALAACKLLANGGIPATVNGVNNATCSTLNATAQISSVEMAHIWLKVTISGTAYVFDPSYKTYTYKSGLNLASVMGLSPGHTLTDATMGSSTGTDSIGTGAPVSYVQTVNSTKLNSDLQNYASSLLSYIKSHNMQGAQIEDIVGGGVIVPDNSTLRQTTLPYADPAPPYVFHTWTPPSDIARYNAIPDQYRTLLTVEGKTKQWQLIGGVYTEVDAEMFNPTLLYVDEIYGRRLSVETDFTAAGIGTTQPEYYNQNACIALDAQPWNTWPSAQCLVTYSYTPPGSPGDFMARTVPTNLILTANHPYAASSNSSSTTADGTYMDATVNKPVQLITSLSIVHGWGDASAALFNKWSGERAGDSPLPELFTAPKCPGGEGGEGDLCPQYYGQPSGGFTREKDGGAWLAQFARAAKLNAAMANAVPQIHHALGVVFGEAALQGQSNYPSQPPGMIVADNFDRIDVDAGISVSARTSTTAATSSRRGAILALAASSAALEGSISGQLNDVVDTSSTATRFEWGNSPDPDHSSRGQNPFGIGPQKFYQYDLGNYSEVAGSPGQPSQGLSWVDGGASGSCSGNVYENWPLPATLTAMDCYGSSPTPGMTNDFANWIAPYAQNGFTVVTSKEVFLGPGQRGGEIIPVLNSEGHPYQYSHAQSQQRGGAFVALQVDSNGDPTQVAHIIIGGNGITKGGGGGTQPDDKTTYDPATAADILKTRFVDRSKLLGVDLSNGTLGTTSPVSISIGSGGAPYELFAGASWHPGPPPEGYAPESPIAPQAGWTRDWLNSLTFSGSGLEAMGQSDIRGAIGAIVSFYAAQDIYQATETPSREVVGVLTQSWWAHQLSGNIVTANVGGNARQFIKIATGDWITPGAGYATGLQTGTRVPYEDKCFHGGQDNPPYALSRGWDSHTVSFAATNAQGDVQNFSYFMNPYYTDDIRQCGELKGFRLQNWTYPYGVTVTPAYTPITVGVDQLDALSTVSNSVGRGLSFTPTTASAGTQTMTYSDSTTQPASITDAMTNVTSFAYQGPQAMTATQRPVPYALLSSVTTPEHTSAPNVKYVYDTLGRINSVMDAVAIQQPGSRNPYNFFIADGTRGERDDPLGQSYTVVYDTYGHASRFIDEIGAEMDALIDSRERPVHYIYPEGDCEAFAYDDQNNTTDYWKVDKASGCNTGAGTSHVLHASATWDPGWNKPLMVTDANGAKTTLKYYGSGTGASEIEQATLPPIPEGTAVYNFDYDPTSGQLADMTGPTNIVTHNDYDPTTHYQTAATLDYSTGSGHLNLKTQYGYDIDGNVSVTTDPKGNTTSTTWDANRRKVEDDHHQGNQFAAINAAEKTLYDQVNRVTDNQRASSISGSTITWLTTKHTTYTPTSKVATVTDADSRVTAMSYDDDDRTVTVTDPISRKVHFTYCGAGEPNCAANQVEKEIRAWNSTNACAVSGTLQECYRRLTYFLDGEQQTIKDANGNTTTYGYDGWNRLNLTTFPDSTTEQLTPDANGNVIQRINRNGQTLTYQYNALNWMTQKVSAAPAVTTTWAYLLDGRINELSDTTGADDSITYGYDTAGRMTSTKIWQPGFGATRLMGYTLDANGNRTQLTWPTNDGVPNYFVGYCYDNLNRMVEAQENATDCSTNTNLLASYTYDTQSRRTNITYGNTTQVQTPSPASYSAAGDLLSLAHVFPTTSNNNKFSYSYTDAHQTQTIAASNSAWFWQPSTNSSTGYTPNALNQYSAIGSQTTGGTNCQGIAQGLSYDCNGNLTFDGTYTYTYDSENHLLTAHTSVGSNISASYLYDPLGRRTEKSGHGVTTTYFLNDGTDEVSEYDSGKNLISRNIAGPAIDESIAIVTASTGAKEYFHSDRQGSVVAMSDSSGNLVEGPYTYDAWGNCFVGVIACSMTGEPYRFTGRRLDPETGLYYYRARYYDSAKGRFLQADSVGYEADVNLYTYVGNDPTGIGDPTGNDAWGSGCPVGLHGCGGMGSLEGCDVTFEGSVCATQSATNEMGTTTTPGSPQNSTTSASNSKKTGPSKGQKPPSHGDPAKMIVWAEDPQKTYSTFYLQLQDRSGVPIPDAYQYKETVTPDTGINGNHLAPVTVDPSKGTYAIDQVGWVPPDIPPAHFDQVSIQKFTVWYKGQKFELSTRMRHENYSNNGVTRNTDRVVVP
jgi:RHS repeat-associated protein